MPFSHKSAVLSPCGTYRYLLTRGPKPGEAERAARTALWVMLNPSTADAEIDDPTIRRVVGFTAAFGFQRAAVVNLFAFRATDPYDVRDAKDPVGPFNDNMIGKAASEADLVICAWGVYGVLHDRDLAVLSELSRHGVRPYCLGTTKDGHPRHPLYVKADEPLVAFTGRTP